MNAVANTFAIRQIQGFEVHTLQSGRAALAVVAERLGQHGASLRDIAKQLDLGLGDLA